MGIHQRKGDPKKKKKNPAPEPTDFNFNYRQRTGQEISKMNLKHLVVTECKKVLQKEFQQWVHDKEIQKPTERAPNHKSWDNLNYKINKINIHEAILIKKMKTNIP